MGKRTYDEDQETTARAAGAKVRQQKEEMARERRRFPEEEPLHPGDNRQSRVSVPGNYPQMLARVSATNPSLAQRTLLQMQQQVGNRGVQRIIEAAREHEEAPEVSPEIEQAIERQRGRGRGRPLEPRVREQMESAFGADFSRVRIYTDAEADRLSQEINAQAFTTRQDIFFKKGKYSPQTDGGLELIAHELAHVLQQTAEFQAKLNPVQVIKTLSESALRLMKVMDRDNYLEFLNELYKLEKSEMKLCFQALKEIVKYMGKSKMKEYGGTESGLSVLKVIRDKLLKGDFECELRARDVDDAIKAWENHFTEEETKRYELERINNAIKNDPNRCLYERSMYNPLGLRLPVVIYRKYLIQNGGIYYDPNYYWKETCSAAGATISQTFLPKGKKEFFKFPLTYITLGPKILEGSDNNICASIYHEYIHYQQNLFFKKEFAELSEYEMEIVYELWDQKKPAPNSEVDAISKSLALYFENLTNEDIEGHLVYLAQQFESNNLKPLVKNLAILHIITSLNDNSALRMISIIENIDIRYRRLLKQLYKDLRLRFMLKERLEIL